MDEQKQMTPAPYAAGTGSVPVTPDRAAFDRMGYRERLAANPNAYPPDVLESDEIDLAHYLVEQLVLDLDPFPRKPGVEFDYKPAVTEESPFAVLKRLKDDGA